GVGHGGDHLVATVGDQPGQALPEQGSVLGDHHPQRFRPGHGRSGSRTVACVGPPGGLVISRLPSTVRTRCASPDRPLPRAGPAPPRPSSLTRSTSNSSCSATSIVTRFAWLCLAALASSSAAQK